jgi:hypothetical protein
VSTVAVAVIALAALVTLVTLVTLVALVALVALMALVTLVALVALAAAAARIPAAAVAGRDAFFEPLHLEPGLLGSVLRGHSKVSKTCVEKTGTRCTERERTP